MKTAPAKKRRAYRSRLWTEPLTLARARAVEKVPDSDHLGALVHRAVIENC